MRVLWWERPATMHTIIQYMGVLNVYVFQLVFISLQNQPWCPRVTARLFALKGQYLGFLAFMHPYPLWLFWILYELLANKVFLNIPPPQNTHPLSNIYDGRCYCFKDEPVETLWMWVFFCSSSHSEWWDPCEIDIYLETWIRKKEISWTRGNIMKNVSWSHLTYWMTKCKLRNC